MKPAEFIAQQPNTIPNDRLRSEVAGEGQAGRWRKKPVVIHAVQFTKTMAEGRDPLPDGVCFSSRSLAGDGSFPPYADDGKYLVNYSTCHRHYIETLEGRMDVQIGDWIITGVKGEMYPCKADIFALTYEPAGDQLQGTLSEAATWQCDCGYLWYATTAHCKKCGADKPALAAQAPQPSDATQLEPNKIIALAEKCSAEVGRYEGQVVWVKFHSLSSVEAFATGIVMFAALKPHLAAAQATQPNERCTGCNGRGEVGGLRPDGYHSEECPFCKGSGLEVPAAAQAPSLAQAVKAGLAKRFPDDPPMEIPREFHPPWCSGACCNPEEASQLRQWLKCDNCGRDMREHDQMAHCYPSNPAAAQAAHGTLSEAAPTLGTEREAPCPYCDDTGDVHGIDGEWLGVCTECDAATVASDALKLADELERDKWHVSAVTLQRAADCLRALATPNPATTSEPMHASVIKRIWKECRERDMDYVYFAWRIEERVLAALTRKPAK